MKKLLTLTALFALLLCVPAQADVTNYTGLSGTDATDWNDATNWDNGLPRYDTANVDAYIGDTFNVVTTADYLYPTTPDVGKFDVYIGYGGTASFTVSAGHSFNAGENKMIYVGDRNDGAAIVGTGTLNVAGTLLAGDTMRIGQTSYTTVGTLSVLDGGTLTAATTTVQLYRGEMLIGSTATVSMGGLFRINTLNDTYEGEVNMTTNGAAIGTIYGLGTLDVEFDTDSTLVLTHTGAEAIGDSWTIMQNVENFYDYGTTTAGGHFGNIKTQDEDPGGAQARLYSADYSGGSLVVTMIGTDTGGNVDVTADATYQGGHYTRLQDNLNLQNGVTLTVKEGTLDLGGIVIRCGENAGGGTIILQGGTMVSGGAYASINIGKVGTNYGQFILEGGAVDLQDNITINNGLLHLKPGVTVTRNYGNFAVRDTSTVKFDIDTSLGALPEDALSAWTSEGNNLQLESGSTLELAFLNGAADGTVFTLFSGINTIQIDVDYTGEFGTLTVTGLEAGQSVELTYTAESVAAAADGTIIATIVPEPATMSLLALGGIAMLRRRKK